MMRETYKVMMKRLTITALATAIVALLVMGCNKGGETFTIQGTISEADGETLYLEYLGLTETKMIDSVALTRNGNYKIEAPLPEYPDFYRLRLDKQVIPFAVDTLPQTLTINGDAKSFATSYSVEGSQHSTQIREVWLTLLDANVALSKLEKGLQPDYMGQYAVERDSIINSYKQVARKYIYSNPQSPVAYFALFQQIDGNLVFNPYDQKDSKAFAAIANVYHSFQPENPRTQHLYDLALRSIAVVREQKRVAEQVTVDADLLREAGVKETSYIDFTLPDSKGQEVTLSDIVSQKNVLLAFSTMQANWAMEYNQLLASLYRSYGGAEIEIVQVGLDSDPHIWVSKTRDLPWVNLQEREGSYSKLVGYYNLYRLPSLFLITKGGGELHRIESLEQLAKLL